MDGESFDRLSVGVHRLRDKATRRGALGLLLGGSLAAAGTLLGDDAAAKKGNKNKNRKKNNCRGFGGKCSSNRDCCFSNCRNGRCWYGGGGGGGGNKHCGGRRCQNGWDCCRMSGVDVCVPRNHPACFNNGICPGGWRTCGWNGPVRNCCAPGTHCCNNGQFNNFCLNDMFNCNDFFGDSFRAESASEVSEPVPVTEVDPDEFD
ncbi:MAG: hypothetical protein K0Q71_2216 [Thermomicrobiales bacterium]|jgi:hypothetical protein|nr:hypothetical protein [Thermomicrobiales bacterium]